MMNEEKKFDVRLIDRHLEDGSLDQETLQKHLASLPDVSAKSERFDIEQPIVEAMELTMEDEDY